MADATAPQSVSRRVIEAISRERGVEPTELDPLYHSIDPDALNGLFEGSSARPTQTGLQVTFRFAGCRVTVSGDGSVSVAADVEPRVATGGERATAADDTGTQRRD